jgi:urease accessory protein
MRAISVAASGQWAASREVGRVVADFEQRFRRRFVFATEAGWEFLLDLKQAARLRDGDGLVLEDGGIVRVVAQREALVQITAFDDLTLTRLAWHLGNRHLPVQILRHALRIRANPVIEDMIERLGGEIEPITAAFDPEPGAYDHS